MKPIQKKRDRTVTIPPALEKLRLLNERQVSELTGRSIGALRNDRSQRQGMPFVKVGASIRYKAEDVRNFLESHTVQTT